MPENTICKEFEIAIYILNCNESGIPVWLDRIIKNFPQYTRIEISIAMDRLFDLCMLTGKWDMIDGTWTRVFEVCDSARPFFTGLRNATENTNSN